MPKDLFANCPRKLKNRSQNPSTTFELVTDQYAVHGRGSEPEIVDGKPERESSTARIGPVYVTAPAASTAVPTGLVFVRFKPGIEAKDRKSEIERAGYEIAETLSYAPEAAWVRDLSGEIAEALNGIAKLEATPDVENVEPQMLMTRVSK